jgi:hypothetical protein
MSKDEVEILFMDEGQRWPIFSAVRMLNKAGIEVQVGMMQGSGTRTYVALMLMNVEIKEEVLTGMKRIKEDKNKGEKG